MLNSLKDFYLNQVMREEFKTYLIDFLKTQAIEKTFNREPTEYIAEAKEVIEKAFDNLDILFASKSEGKEIKNEAR